MGREGVPKALEDNELSPQADPNTASAAQRMMKLAALKQLQASNPTMYDPIAIDRACIQALGFSNPDQFMAPPSAQAAPPPEMQKQMAEMQVKKQQADAQTLKAQADMLKAQHEASAPHDVQQQQVDTPVDLMTARAKLMDAQTKRHSLGIQQADVMQEDRNRAADRASHEKIQLLELARDIALHPQAAPIAAPIAKQAEQQ